MLAHTILASTRQTWPPFVLVAGLLLIGRLADDDGLFEAVGARLARTRLGARTFLVALLGLVAVVTAILSNTASLLLPGSNLTNLLVLEQAPQPGTAYARHMLPAWLAACAITVAFVAVAFRFQAGERAGLVAAPFRLRIGAAATLAAAGLVVALPKPALPVLAVGLIATASRRVRPKLDVRALSLLFALAVLLGVAGRARQAPARLLGGGVWSTAALGAAASVLTNNLPAAVLLSSQPVSHPDALLIGLDLGPNLAVTGSLSALLWLRAAQTVGARASIATYSRPGVVLVPMTLASALLVGGR